MLKIIKTKTVLPVLLIIIGCVIVYAHVVSYPLINWDDQYYILDNSALRGSWFELIHNAFTTLYHGNYFPLHILSYGIEWKFFQDNPFIYHLDNILLHLLNSLLIFALFYKIIGNMKVAFITAFMFAVHPVHVESVAWVSERKDTLYLFFFLLAFLSQRYFADKNKKRYLLWSYFFYICSLMSKSTAVVFPVILFFTEYCFDIDFLRKKNLKRIIFYIPYIVFSIIFSIIQIKGQKPPLYESKGIIKAVELFMRYMNNIIYPVNLSPRYEIHNDISLFFIVLFIFAAGYLCAKKRLFLWAVLWQLCALLPVLNLIPNQIIMADRYLYLTAIPMYALFGLWINRLTSRGSLFLKKAGLTVFLVSVLLIVLLTINQTLAWKSTASMWKRVMSVQPYDYIPVIELGQDVYDRTYDIDEAMKYLNMAKEKFPDEPEVYYRIGSLYYDIGKHDKAKYFLNYLLGIPSAHFNHTDACVKLMHIYSLEGDFQNELKLFNNPNFQKYAQDIVDDIKQKMSARYDLVTGTHRLLLNNDSNIYVIYENIVYLLDDGFLPLARDLLILSNRNYQGNKQFLFLKGFLNVLFNDMEKAKNIFRTEVYENDFLKQKYSQIILNPEKNILEETVKMFPDKKMFLLEYAVFIIEHNGDDWRYAEKLMNKILESNTGWRFVPRFLYLKQSIMSAKRERGYPCDSVRIHKTEPKTD